MYTKERLNELTIRKIERIKSLQARIRNIQDLKCDIFLPESLQESWNRDIQKHLNEIKQLALWLDENTNLDMKIELGRCSTVLL